MQPVKSSDPAVAWKLIAYFALIMIGAAILTPPLFWAGKSFATSFSSAGSEAPGILNWLTDALTRADFSRYFNRAVLIVAVALIYPLIRWAGFDRSLFPSWAPLSSGARQCLLGFLLAAGFLLLLGWVLVSTGAYKMKPHPNWVSIGAPLFAAVSVGFIEEFFFRGALLGLFLKSLGRTKALLWGTFIFAIVHFLKPPETFLLPSESVTWTSGFALIGQIFVGFSNLNFILAEFLTLFAVGWILAQGRMITGRLWLSVGLHAGWVFGLKYFSALTLSSRALKQGDLLPWIGLNLKIGLAPLVVVLFTGWLVLRLSQSKDQVNLDEEKIRLQEAKRSET